jgi:hypothetical protein
MNWSLSTELRTNAVVATCVVLVPGAAVGACGTPVNIGEASGAIVASTATVAVEPSPGVWVTEIPVPADKPTI